eukprot:2345590-Amphidinium_carterae.2
MSGPECHYFTSSVEMAEVLKQQRRSEVHSASKQAAEAAHYSNELIAKLVQSLRDQLINDGRVDAAALRSAGPTADYPEPNPTAWEDVYDIQGTLFDPQKIKAGIEEIQWILKQNLFRYVPEKERYERQGKSYTLKWVDKNKGDKVRSRIVVRESKKAKIEEEKLERNDVFSAMPLAKKS